MKIKDIITENALTARSHWRMKPVAYEQLIQDLANGNRKKLKDLKDRTNTNMKPAAIKQVSKLLDKWYAVEPVHEELGPEQKQAGQLGPTEKVGANGAVGKLVGS